MELQQKETIQRVIRVFHSVYRELGHGFDESVYEGAMYRALCEKGLRCERRVPIEVLFRGQSIGQFCADLLVNGKALLQLKAVPALTPEHEAQLTNHLRATHFEFGLLLNFGAQPEFKHLAYTNVRKTHQHDLRELAARYAAPQPESVA